MRKGSLLGRTAVLVVATAFSWFAASSALAGPGGHGGGGGGGGYHGGGFHGGPGGYRGGYRGYGPGYYRGGYYGWRGYGGWGCCGWGWGWWAPGFYLSVLPYGYQTYWWGGVPYYYASDNFYQWNGSAGQYETVRAPQSLANQVATGTEDLSLFAYPKNGQDRKSVV